MEVFKNKTGHTYIHPYTLVLRKKAQERYISRMRRETPRAPTPTKFFSEHDLTNVITCAKFEHFKFSSLNFVTVQK